MHQGGKKGALAFTAAVGYTSMREANPIKNADYFEQRTGFDSVCSRKSQRTLGSPHFFFLLHICSMYLCFAYVLLCMYICLNYILYVLSVQNA